MLSFRGFLNNFIIGITTNGLAINEMNKAILIPVINIFNCSNNDGSIKNPNVKNKTI